MWDARSAARGAGDDWKAGTADLQHQPYVAAQAPGTTPERMQERERRELARRMTEPKRRGAERKLRWPATKKNIAV